MRLIGLDPGLRHTGWGVIETAGNRLIHVGDGVVHAPKRGALAERLVELFRQLNAVLDEYRPEAAAVEETFVNKNPASTLKLGVARGVVLLAPAARGIPVFEYSANLVKKSVVGVGHAEKPQVEMMVKRLLPAALLATPDAADALAVAICHAHHAATEARWGRTNINTLSRRKPTVAETARARRLRQNSTDAEMLLWLRLRDRRFDDLKFRRQEPILGFTADFVCHERRVVIEIDGGQHDARAEQDAHRTRLLEQAGYRVLRFWNNDVLENMDGVLETIRESIAERAAP
jgi:crossover junction endodeoxyribonuclease RuvC